MDMERNAPDSDSFGCRVLAEEGRNAHHRHGGCHNVWCCYGNRGGCRGRHGLLNFFQERKRCLLLLLVPALCHQLVTSIMSSSAV